MKETLEAIERISPQHAERLRAAGVATLSRLLAEGGEPDGRARLARRTGIREELILKWVNLSDLCRIVGLSEQRVELLEAAGVETVSALRSRTPGVLIRRMREVNAAKNLVEQVPSEVQVALWISHANALVPVVSEDTDR